MRISIWQQFSSNHSSSFTTVGVFPIPQKANQAAGKLREILDSIREWHEQNSEQSIELAEEGWAPCDVEIQVGKQYGFEWKSGIAWFDEAEITVWESTLLITNKFQAKTGGTPFDILIDALGGQGMIDGDVLDSTGDDFTSKVVVELECILPNEATGDTLKNQFEWATNVHQYELQFSLEMWLYDIPSLSDYIETFKRLGCKKIAYRFAHHKITTSRRMWLEND